MDGISLESIDRQKVNLKQTKSTSNTPNVSRTEYLKRIQKLIDIEPFKAVELLENIYQKQADSRSNQSAEVKSNRNEVTGLDDFLEKLAYSEISLLLIESYLNTSNYSNVHSKSKELIDSRTSASIQTAKAHFFRGVAFRLQGDLINADSSFSQSRSLIKNEDSDIVAQINYQTSIILLNRQEFERAFEFLDKANAVFIRMNDYKSQAKVENVKGVIRGVQNRFNESIDFFLSSLENHQLAGDNTAVPAIYNNVALTYRRIGEPDKAKEFFEVSILKARSVNDKYSESIALSNLGITYNILNQKLEARELFLDSIVLARGIEDRASLVRSLYGLIKIELEKGNLSIALDYANEAFETSDDVDNVDVKHTALKGLIEVQIRVRELDAALKNAEKLLIQSTKLSRKIDEKDAYELLASIYEEKENYKQAFNSLRHQVSLEIELSSDNRDRRLKSLQSHFETKDKLAKLKILNKENEIKINRMRLLEQGKSAEFERKQNQLLMFGSAVVFVLLLFLLQYRKHLSKTHSRRLDNKVREKTQEIALANIRLEQEYRDAKHRSVTDNLTGLHNRNYLFDHIEFDIEKENSKIEQLIAKDQLDTLAENNTALSFFLIDADFFKEINDSFGHAAGDSVLQQMATILKTSFRETDYVIRWGGEEFLVITRFASTKNNAHLAETLRRAIDEYSFIINAEQVTSMTCSIGYASYPLSMLSPFDLSWAQIIEVADFCLYSAKSSGRNCWIGLEPSQLLVKSTFIEYLPEKIHFYLDRGYLNVSSSLEADAIEWHSR